LHGIPQGSKGWRLAQGRVHTGGEDGGGGGALRSGENEGPGGLEELLGGGAHGVVDLARRRLGFLWTGLARGGERKRMAMDGRRAGALTCH